MFLEKSSRGRHAIMSRRRPFAAHEIYNRMSFGFRSKEAGSWGATVGAPASSWSLFFSFSFSFHFIFLYFNFRCFCVLFCSVLSILLFSLLKCCVNLWHGVFFCIVDGFWIRTNFFWWRWPWLLPLVLVSMSLPIPRRGRLFRFFFLGGGGGGAKGLAHQIVILVRFEAILLRWYTGCIYDVYWSIGMKMDAHLIQSISVWILFFFKSSVGGRRREAAVPMRI